MRAFCTIITSSHIPYALTLYRSLTRFGRDEQLYVLIVDTEETPTPASANPGVHYITAKEIYSRRKADEIFSKYAKENPDALRWALKPVFISYLLEKGLSKIIYADCDLYFFNDYEFLFEKLDQHAVLLTPGATTRNPQQHEEEFLSGYKYGLFNAGFIGAGKNAVAMLNWWADCCAYRVETNFADGLFVDQKYLDAAPVLFDNIGIVRHKGCNVAFWNQHEYKRTKKGDAVLINEEFPVIFIHFTNKYIPELLNGNDPLLYPYYLEYEAAFSKSGHSLKEFIPGMPEYKKPGPLAALKRKLLIRTRIKRWLFRLSQ